MNGFKVTQLTEQAETPAWPPQPMTAPAVPGCLLASVSLCGAQLQCVPARRRCFCRYERRARFCPCHQGACSLVDKPKCSSDFMHDCTENQCL